MSTSCGAGWHAREIELVNGRAERIKIPVQSQIVSHDWDRIARNPYLVYMPEKKRLLIMVAVDYPIQEVVITSDDLGGTWSRPRYLHADPQGRPDAGHCTSMAYMGDGRLMIRGETGFWFSDDFGQTWGRPIPVPPAPNGSILTTYGMGSRYRPGTDPPTPRDIGLIRWGVRDAKLNSDTTIADAPFDSDLRNVFAPDLTGGRKPVYWK